MVELTRQLMLRMLNEFPRVAASMRARVADRVGGTIADLRNALSSIAMDTPAGALTTNDQNIIVRATADNPAVDMKDLTIVHLAHVMAVDLHGGRAVG